MPYCRRCGKEIPADSSFCPYCGSSLVQQPIQRLVIEKNYGRLILGLALVTVIFGGLIFSATVEIADCPECNNHPLYRHFCPHCGGDGKVTLFQLIKLRVQD